MLTCALGSTDMVAFYDLVAAEQNWPVDQTRMAEMKNTSEQQLKKLNAAIVGQWTGLPFSCLPLSRLPFFFPSPFLCYSSSQQGVDVLCIEHGTLAPRAVAALPLEDLAHHNFAVSCR